MMNYLDYKEVMTFTKCVVQKEYYLSPLKGIKSIRRFIQRSSMSSSGTGHFRVALYLIMKARLYPKF